MRPILSFLVFVLVGGAALLRAETLSPKAQARLDHMRDEAAGWAADPVIVDAVLAQNTQLPAELGDLTQEKWEALSAKSPFLRRFLTHPAAELIRARAGDRISEAFLSDAQGRKIAFLSKPTNWCHQGKPKHDLPMGGKTWQGAIEVDRSAGTLQIQISVPVLSGGTPVGSLVIGVTISTLTGE